jgi:hypothetical protein
VALVCDLTDQRLKTNGASKAPFVLSEEEANSELIF